MHTTKAMSQNITLLLNSAIAFIKNVLPLQYTISKPKLEQDHLSLVYAVLIAITGDMKGKLILAGATDIFGHIGEKMFGMKLEGDMLKSFSGELGNMIAGGLSTNIGKSGVYMDISAPSILEGNTILSGYKTAIRLPLNLEMGNLEIYLLVDGI